MHGAPSVTYPVGRSRLAGRLLALAWLMGCAAIAAWTWQAQFAGWPHAAATAMLLAAGAGAGWNWWRTPSGRLAWDRSAWSWQGLGRTEPHPGMLECIVDLQDNLLLRWRAGDRAGGQLWLWLERERDPPRWDALRRAVYSRARTEEAPPGPQPPPATS